MTPIDTTETRPVQRKRASLPDNLALPAMAIVSAAIGVLLNQAGLPIIPSAVTGLLLLMAFWFAHAARARGRRVAELQREIGRLGVELHRVRGFGRGMAPPRPDYMRGSATAQNVAQPAAGPAHELQSIELKAAPQAALSSTPAAATARAAAEPAAGQVAAPTAAEQGEAAMAGSRRAAAAANAEVDGPADFAAVLAAELRHEMEPRHAVEPASKVARQSAGATPDPWSYRPSSPPELPMAPSAATPSLAPPVQAGRQEPRLDAPPEAVTPAVHADQAGSGQPSARDLDVEMIQSLIKKLADEVSAAERSDGHGLISSAMPTIESSLDALRATADTMRGTQGFGRRVMPPPTPSLPEHTAMAPSHGASGAAASGMPPPVGPMHVRLAALAEAINARRADVLIEAILGLADHRPRHYEVSLRLRGADGSPLDTEGMIETLRDTGLLPVLDATRLARTAQVARRLRERGKTGAIFSEIDGGSLGHDQFIREFSAAYSERDGFTGQLVLSLSQSDVRRFGRREWSMIADMRDLGYQFALQDVTDLDMDLEGLRGQGFAFVKLDADVFLEGLPTAGGVIPANDICRHLAELGLTLIVGAIDDELRLAQIFGFGVLYGQGQMFGGARPLRAEALAAAARPASGSAGAGHAAA